MHKYNMAVGRDLKDRGQMRPKASTSRGDSFSRFDRSLGLTGAVLAVLVGCLLLGLLGCGLQDVPYFGPPIFSYETGVFKLSDSGNVSASTSTSIFRGYEIFYRVYSEESSANTDLQSLTTWANLVTESATMDPDTFFVNAQDLGFVRIRRQSDSAAPLINLLIEQSDSSQSFLLNIPSNSNWYINPERDESSQTIVGRTLASTTSTTKLSFYELSNYEVGDQDYDGISNPLSGSSLYFVFFAVGYWTSTEDLSEHYGAPTVIPQVVTYMPLG